MSRPPDLAACAWRLSELGEAVELLCRRVARRRSPEPPGVLHLAASADPQEFGRDLDRLVAAFDLEAEPLAVTYAAADAITGPAIVRLPDAGDPADARFVVVWRATRTALTLLDRERRWRPVPRAALADALRAAADAEGAGEIEPLIASLAVGGRRASAIRRALLAERSADRQVADAWLLRPDPGSPLADRLRGDGVVRDGVVMMALHATQFALWIAAWGVVGRSALDGRAEWGWLAAWGLVLATLVPVQAAAGWLQGTVALRVGRLLKERLLAGALRLDADTVRTEGAGQLLGRVIESDALESLAIAGGFQAGLAAIELLMAAAVLGAGVAAVGHLVLLAAVVGAAVLVAWRGHAHRREWATWRLHMTDTLVERMAGHRTRLAQEMPERWHADEDRALEEYVARSAALDRLLPMLSVAVPRAWTTSALLVLVPAVAGGAPTAPLAVSVGGLLLAALALRRFTDGLAHISSALVAWRQAQPLFAAAARRPSPSGISGRSGAADEAQGQPVLDIRTVSFRYAARPEPVLHACAAARSRSRGRCPSGAARRRFARPPGAGPRPPRSAGWFRRGRAPARPGWSAPRHRA